MNDSSLIAHCYRLLGSTTEAIEIATEVTARPSTGAGGGASGVGGGVVEAATLACLTRAGSRPLPSDLAAPSAHPEGALSESSEILWLEPIPEHLMDGRPIDLGLIAALQRIPPRERAATILHDIEGWPEDRITTLLGDVRPTPLTVRPSAAVPDEALLARYRAAFEQYDVPAIVTLFTDDAIWEMPPFTSWFRGARDIGRLITTHCPAEHPGDQYLVPLKANGLPAFAVYMRDPRDNIHHAFQIQVLTLTATAIVHAVAFFDLSLFQTFHLPDLLQGLPPNPYDGTLRPHIERRH
ncbi:RNA polymerase subunit sigma-70 [Kribbella sp. NBC_00662]|uniref:RNA polymerase subunit sigma-70 n=1 Tax=Kribbella sp. NBC_00662 TaxID=2975969 RepID=UPI0032569123